VQLAGRSATDVVQLKLDAFGVALLAVALMATQHHIYSLFGTLCENSITENTKKNYNWQLYMKTSAYIAMSQARLYENTGRKFKSKSFWNILQFYYLLIHQSNI
jgi:hypothetical protein